MRTRLLVLAAASALLTGCGALSSSSTDIPSVTKCLKDAKIETKAPEDDDKDIEEGISGTADLGGDQMTIVVAARVKSDDKVKKFQSDVKGFTSNLTARDKKSFGLESGADGKYVWVVAGAKGSDTYSKARDCVKP